MRHYRSNIANSLSTAAVIALANACRLGAGPDDQDLARCTSTYLIGDHGCALLTLLVEAPPKPWPEFYRFDIRATSVRNNAGFHSDAAVTPNIGTVPLRLRRMSPGAAGTGDTVTVWIVARMLDDVRPIVVGVPLPTFAVDSIAHVVTFAGAGSRPKADTVRIFLRSPTSALQSP